MGGEVIEDVSDPNVYIIGPVFRKKPAAVYFWGGKDIENVSVTKVDVRVDNDNFLKIQYENCKSGQESKAIDTMAEELRGKLTAAK